MFIKEIILDGFKSYPNRTVITGLDRNFNAITGLNGSGKSNIFDALCFILGIQTLSHVRASSVQDLVYKKGMAGIEKASVTVVFDNTNKAGSPLGMQDFEEITVSRTIYQGKTKYFINGYTTQVEKIKSMFLSVQLNINNPTFLVMQGRVRKVVSMKPIEILGLLEESAGTSIYQIKKDSSLKLIKKKENKLDEINNLINNEISPKIEQLEKDKQNYHKWKTSENEINRLNKIITAYDFYMHSRSTEIKNNEMNEYEKHRGEMMEEINKIFPLLNELKLKFENLNKNKSSKYGDTIETFEEEKNKFLSEMNVAQNSIKLIEKNLEITVLENENFTKKITELQNENDKNSQLKTTLENNKKLFENDLEHLNEVLKQVNVALDNLKNGKEDENNIISNAKLIADAENNKKNANVEKEQLIDQIEILNNENKSKKVKMTEMKARLKDCEKNAKKIKAELNTVKEKYDSLLEGQEAGNDNMIEAIQKDIEQKQSEIGKYEIKVRETAQKTNAHIDFNFRDPMPNFDRSKIKGRVIKNFTVPNDKFLKALEKAAGNKLYNVIIDNQNTGSLLLKNKCLFYNVTMLPLNKIQSKPFSEDKIDEIKRVSRGEAELALNLINYKDEVKPVMQYVFGNVFICNTQEVAKKLAFDPNIKVKAISLDGDVYDPNGIMSGGANNQRSLVLKVAQELMEYQNKVKTLTDEVKILKNKLRKMGENQQIYMSLKKKIDDLQRGLQENSKENVLKSIENFESDIKKNEEEISQKQARIEEISKLIQKYSEDLDKLKKEENELNRLGKSEKKESYYTNKIKELNGQIKQATNKITKVNKELNDIDFKQKKAEESIKEMQEEIEQGQESISKTKEELNVKKQEISNMEGKIKDIEAKIYEQKSLCMKEEKELSEINAKIQKLENQKKIYKDEIEEVEAKLKKYNNDVRESEKALQILKKKHDWIENEMSFFGMKGSDYDFSEIDIKKITREVNKMKEQNDILKRKVNMKVESMADQYNQEYIDLVKKREVVLKDKANIQKAIDDLDMKRKTALEDIFGKVSVTINKIFAKLLPNTQAKLEMVDSSDLMRGVTLKVAFNGVWKKSLSELSGGQSSLLALSLILSLLRYKPAPIYIFDEIDAALDLSHTSNLGHMLKDEFPESQFIIISLKDGMFSNANVLYKVSFVDGASKVDRIAKNTL